MADIKHQREEVLQYIITHKLSNDGNSPTIREIMQMCHISSSSVVSYILRDLQDAGKIRIIEGSRGIIVTGGMWRME
jgi:SOS-response transcriptional repressor LexA